jgi:hypothetical protein
MNPVLEWPSASCCGWMRMCAGTSINVCPRAEAARCPLNLGNSNREHKQYKAPYTMAGARPSATPPPAFGVSSHAPMVSEWCHGARIRRCARRAGALYYPADHRIGGGHAEHVAAPELGEKAAHRKPPP